MPSDPNVELKDLHRQCKEQNCQEPFVITVGEQEFFKDKGLNLPVRCKKCRAKKRAERNANTIGDM